MTIRIGLPAILVISMQAALHAVEDPGPPDRADTPSSESIEALVKKLGSEVWEERDKAYQELIRLGERALPFLKKASESPDPEVSMRAARAVVEIGKARPCPFLEHRLHLDKRRELKAYGGSRHSEAAVLRGLIWLKNHQNANGLWACKTFAANCKKGRCGGEGASDEYDLGVTGLAVLAFLGAGHTNKLGKFQPTVESAVRALMERQGPKGFFGKPSEGRVWFYNHAVCTWALSELYGMNQQSTELHKAAKAAVNALVDCQSPYLGWRYGRQTGEHDTSCTSWAVCALKTAQSCGLKVPKECFDGALNWFDKATDDKYYKSGYQGKWPGEPAHVDERKGFERHESMTAAVLYSRWMILGKKVSNRVESLGAAGLLKKDVPDWDEVNGRIDMMYWYWGSLAMFQMGRAYWKTWNEPMKEVLVSSQHKEGCLFGSWDPVGAWGKTGGRVYSTAINVLTLEVYYRYERFQRPR